MIGGDSAGGHLALSLLSHLSFPHNKVPRLKNDGQSFKGLILVSPWVTFDQSAQSFTDNARKDSLSSQAVKKWSKMFMGSSPVDPYNTPLDAFDIWWKDAPVERVLILAGGDEVFRDDIQHFARKFKVCIPIIQRSILLDRERV